MYEVVTSLCLGCGACAEACPQGAIRRVEPAAAALAVAVSPPEVKAEPVAVGDRRGRQAAPVASSYQGARLASLLGSALLWVGREVVPNLLAAWRRPPLLAGRQVPELRQGQALRRMHRQRWRGR